MLIAIHVSRCLTNLKLEKTWTCLNIPRVSVLSILAHHYTFVYTVNYCLLFWLILVLEYHIFFYPKTVTLYNKTEKNEPFWFVLSCSADQSKVMH